MIKYLIPLLLLTSCEASLTCRVMPGNEVIETPSQEEGVLVGDYTDGFVMRFLQIEEPESYSHGSNAGWSCSSCGQYNYSHSGVCSDCGAGK